VFGQLRGSFQKYFLGSIPDSYFHHRLSQLTLYFVYPATGQFITVYIAVAGFMYTAEHATQKLQEQCLAAILRQNIARFDNLGAREIFTNITANMDLVVLGISEKSTSAPR
jgi:ATP-binding cassette subfamily B (MDR/TAP) protein 1